MLFGVGVPDPDSLMDPVLRRIDLLLEDEALVDTVLLRQRSRSKQSARRGRPGTPAEVVSRMLALEQWRNWTFNELEWEEKGNLCYRRFCRIDAGRCQTPRRGPGAKR